jgi:large subunit ribosomal protein L9
MQVILLENLEGKGAAGDVIKVANGYARNYLLPRSIAITATESNVKTLEHRRAKLAEKKAQDLEAAEAIKAKIDSQSITFEAKSGDSGRLFGSITSQDVADAIHEHFGVFVDKRKISDGTPIKNVGVHPVTIKIFPEVSAVMRILVGTPEEIEAAEAAAKLAVEKAAARAAAEAEAAARAEEEAAAAAAAADAESDAVDYEERFDAVDAEYDAQTVESESPSVDPAEEATPVAETVEDAPADDIAEEPAPEEAAPAVEIAEEVPADDIAEEAAPEEAAPAVEVAEEAPADDTEEAAPDAEASEEAPENDVTEETEPREDTPAEE